MNEWQKYILISIKIKIVSKTPTTSNMEFFVTLFNCEKLLTNFTKSFILDVAEHLDTPLGFDIKKSTKPKETLKITIP